MWLEPIKTKSAEECADALTRILARSRVAGVRRLLSDNGTEFSAEFDDVCRQHNIQHTRTNSYSARSNGIVERANGNIRKMMRQVFAQTKANNWIDYLADIESAHNSNYNENMKTSANQIWERTLDRVKVGDIQPVGDKQNTVRQGYLKSIKKKINTYKSHEYAVGDEVRIRMDVLFTNIRKAFKNDVEMSKNLIITYSPTVYRITQIYRPRNAELAKLQYECSDSNGNVIRAVKPYSGEVGDPKRFYSSELTPATELDEPMTMQQALRLNKVKPSDTDLVTV
jgi:hypothetical protein